MAKDKWEGWQKMGAGDEPIHDWQAEPDLIGVFIEKREHVGDNDSNIYILEKSNGDRVAFWGNTLIDTRLKNVVVGEEVGLEYLGKAKSEKTGRTYHNFEIYRRPLAPTVNKKSEEVDPNDLPF